MAEQILSTDSMQQVAGKVNNGFAALLDSYQQVTDADSMQTVASKVATNFAAITDDAGIQGITEADSMQTIASKIASNFVIAESAEPDVPVVEGSTFSFLHVSDTHGKTTAMTRMASMLNAADNDCAFGILTGDIKGARIAPSFGAEAFCTDQNKRLALGGNHDCYDRWRYDDTISKDTSRMRSWMVGVLGQSVHWGSDTSLYWYKDFQTSDGHIVRVIGMDQYEINAAAIAASGSYTPTLDTAIRYNQIYTTAQFDWLVARLKELDSDDHVILAMHQCPFSNNNYASAVTPTEPYDEDLLFCSENMFEQPFTESGYVNYNSVICKVMRAYMNKSDYSETLANGTTGSSLNVGSFTITADFSNMANNPATFWGYIFGHLHLDMCAFVPDPAFPNQPMLGVNCSDYNSGAQTGDDLITDDGRDYDYRVNKVTLDFDNRTVLVERIGQQVTVGGRTRDKILFNIDTMAVSHPTT